MTADVTNFPGNKRGEPEFLVGPFKVWKVVIGGRFIPRLTGRKDSDGTYWLTVDDRFAAPFKTFEDAYGAAALIAEALAVASGYSHAGADNKDMPFAPKAMGISSEEKP